MYVKNTSAPRKLSWPEIQNWDCMSLSSLCWPHDYLHIHKYEVLCYHSDATVSPGRCIPSEILDAQGSSEALSNVLNAPIFQGNQPRMGPRRGKHLWNTTGAGSSDGENNHESWGLVCSPCRVLWIRPQQLGISQELPGHVWVAEADQFLLIYSKQQICPENCMSARIFCDQQTN